MKYITKYIKEEDSIQVPEGKLIYFKVTPVFSDEQCGPERVDGSCFLYDDYASLLKPGDTFYEIALIEVEEGARRKGIGTKLIKEFFAKCNPDSVVLKAGITREELYYELISEDSPITLTEYIYKNIVPFYEKLGFTDVNHTVFYFEETVPMLWPKSKAEEAKRRSEEFKQKMA